MFDEMGYLKGLLFDELGSSFDPSYDLSRLYQDMLTFDFSAPPVQVAKHSIAVIINYDVGYGNKLYIRGNTSPLNWSYGKVCQNKGANVWVFLMEFAYPTSIEFKVLINDSIWETGNNHSVRTGNTIIIKPTF